MVFDKQNDQTPITRYIASNAMPGSIEFELEWKERKKDGKPKFTGAELVAGYNGRQRDDRSSHEWMGLVQGAVHAYSS